MKDGHEAWALAALATVGAHAASYGLALAGEPSSAWLWGLIL
jgi:hypothetical protein